MKKYLVRLFGCAVVIACANCGAAGNSGNNSNTLPADKLQTQTGSKQEDTGPRVGIPQDSLPKQDTLQKEVKQEVKKEVVKYDGIFVVSFFSRGSGTDSKMFDGFKAFIESFNKKNNTTIKYTLKRWGKEGEKDLCFEPDNNPHFETFTAEAKSFLAASKLVRVKEHADCRE